MSIEEDWFNKCGECAFYSPAEIHGRCYHPKNDRWSCVGFREEGVLKGFFRKRISEEKCGPNAVYFKKQTLETFKEIKEKDKAAARARNEERKKVEEHNNRIETRLNNHIWKVLDNWGYDICLCNHITFNYKNEEGRKVIVDELLKEFDIRVK